MQFPLWATPERRTYLVEMFQKSRGFCVYGEGQDCMAIRAIRFNPSKPVPKRFRQHLYEFHSEWLIEYWKEDDRDMRAYLWKLERKHLHALPPITHRGQFDSIRRDEFLAERPVFRIVGIGVSAFTQRRIAQVEIPDLHTTIWVDLSGVALKTSKNKLRKLARYNRGAVPKGLVDDIDTRCRKAVERYLNS